MDGWMETRERERCVTRDGGHRRGEMMHAVGVSLPSLPSLPSAAFPPPFHRPYCNVCIHPPHPCFSWATPVSPSQKPRAPAQSAHACTVHPTPAHPRHPFSTLFHRHGTGSLAQREFPSPSAPVPGQRHSGTGQFNRKRRGFAGFARAGERMSTSLKTQVDAGRLCVCDL